MNVLYDIVGRIGNQASLSAVPFDLPRPGRPQVDGEAVLCEAEREDKFASVMAGGVVDGARLAKPTGPRVAQRRVGRLGHRSVAQGLGQFQGLPGSSCMDAAGNIFARRQPVM